MENERRFVRRNHLLDARLDGAKELVDLLDPRPRGRPDMKAELAGTGSMDQRLTYWST